MSTSYLSRVASTPTPQSAPLRPDQVPNSAGGYSWRVDRWEQLHRWLILGSEKGTYYIGEVDLTKANIQSVLDCIRDDGARVAREAAQMLRAYRAAKPDTALYTLALAARHGNDEAKAEAYEAIGNPMVIHTGYQLLRLAEFLKQIGMGMGLKGGGWGPRMRRAFSNWFLSQNTRHLAYELVKYDQRDGWRMADLLRLSHAPSDSVGAEMHALFDWVLKREYTDFGRIVSNLDPIWGYKRIRQLQEDGDDMHLADVIRQFRLPREAVPTDMLKQPEVWDALLDDMPVGATIRNLATFTRHGILKPMGQGRTPDVVERLTSPERVAGSHVHPVAVLDSMLTYKQGHGDKGSNTWTPLPQIIDALDKAFYLAYGGVRPSNKRIMLALDVSSSMVGNKINGLNHLDARMGSAAMALVTAATEPNHMFTAFTSANHNNPKGMNGHAGWGLAPLDISPRQRLDDVLRLVDGLPFGGTDCALPMLYAMEQKLQLDAFVIYTDSESWAGTIHAAEALRRYRNQTGIPAKLVVVAMCANAYSVGDPDDAGTLNVVGFDTAVPQLISDFIAGVA